MLMLLLVVLFTFETFNCTKVSAASKKEYVYVLISSDDGYKKTYTYNKNGLITKIDEGGSAVTYKYDSKKRIKKCDYTGAPGTIRHSTVTYSYDKKGRIYKLNSEGSHLSNTYCFTYSYDKNNKVVKVIEDFSGHGADSKYSYNKSKQIIKKTSGNSIYNYAYDKRGNLKSVKNTYSSTEYTNKYNKNKCLIKRTTSTGNTKKVCTFKYKKIKVDKKYVKQIKEQQWALLNNDVQFIFPPYY